jgi:hypothetical protein
MEWVSPQDWFMIPIPGEKTREEAENREYPNLYFALNDEKHTLDVGLVSNTLSSSERMKNLLLGYHRKDRKEFLESMQALDRGFKTVVNEKEYARPLSVPKYQPSDSLLPLQTNKVSDAALRAIFKEMQRIREKGVQDKEARQKLNPRSKWIRILPSLDIAKITLGQRKQDFANALTQLKPLAEICMRIKTKSQIDRQKRKEASSFVNIRICPACHRRATGRVYCSHCRVLLVTKRVRRDSI